MADTLVYISKAIADFSSAVALILAGEEGNILFSPCGIFTVLCMAYQGAGGNTAKHLKNTLYITDVVTSAEECRLLMTTFEKLVDVKFSNVSNIAIRDDLEVNEAYTKKIIDVFATRLIRTSFAKKNQPEKKINAWLEKSSKSRLHNIVASNDCPEQSDLIMVSGVYFKGNWMQRFEVYKNLRDDFYVTESETNKCAMVKMQSIFKYDDRDDINAQVVCIGFKNPSVSLLVILPRTRSGLKDLESRLFKRNIADIYENLSNTSVVVTMPKLKLESTLDLEEVLGVLGLGDLYSNRVNFENMLKAEGIKTDKIMHKTYFETGDQGNIVVQGNQREAAMSATTSMTLSGPSYSKFSFYANHPFIFMVCYHDKCFLPLIVGRYVKP